MRILVEGLERCEIKNLELVKTRRRISGRVCGTFTGNPAGKHRRPDKLYVAC